MTERDHDRAIELIARRGTEDLSSADSTWLESHLQACRQCADYAADFEKAGQLLRSVTVTATASLVTATQARVRARAIDLQEQHARAVLIALSFCIGVLSSTFSAWLWWKFGGWVAERLGLSSAIVEPGVLFFLILPALVIAVLMLVFPRPLLEETFLASLVRERPGGNQ